MKKAGIHYKDIMLTGSNELFISASETLSAAMKRVYQVKNRMLIIQSEENNAITGVITPRELLRVLDEGGLVSDKLIDHLFDDFLVVDANSPVDLNQVRQFKSHIITADNRAIGTLTQETASKALLQLINQRWQKMVQEYRFMGKQNNNTSFLPGYVDEIEMNVLAFDNDIKTILESNKRLWNILQYSPNSIYIADGQGDTLYANEAFEKSSHLPVQEMLGVNVVELEKKGLFNPAVTPVVLRERKPCSIKQQGVGNEWWIVSGVPVFDKSGNIDMVVTNAMDLEEVTTLKTYVEKNNKSVMDADHEMLGLEKIICSGKHMKEVIDMVDRVAQLDTTVLITGESGVGKGVVSRLIHEKSDRNKEKIIEINCSAIPESLFESELFGYETGAFSGAKVGGKPGLIEMANKGTLVLDEIGDMPITLQSKLLKVLQDKKLTRVGGVKEREIDLRIIASTNQSLEVLMEKGLFRSDLYYRLNVFPIHLMPLRERKEEITDLMNYYLSHYNRKHHKQIRFTDRALKTVKEYPWYGNIRELMFFVERMIIMHDHVVDDVDLREIEWFRKDDKGPITVNRIIPLKIALNETERQLFVLAAQKGSTSYEVAKILETSQPNAYRKLKKYVAPRPSHHKNE